MADIAQNACAWWHASDMITSFVLHNIFPNTAQSKTRQTEQISERVERTTADSPELFNRRATCHVPSRNNATQRTWWTGAPVGMRLTSRPRNKDTLHEATAGLWVERHGGDREPAVDLARAPRSPKRVNKRSLHRAVTLATRAKNAHANKAERHGTCVARYASQGRRSNSQ